MLESRKYTFDVEPKLTKKQIRFFFKKFYNLSIPQINSHLLPIKRKQLIMSRGSSKKMKRIIIRLNANQNLPKQLYMQLEL